MRTMKIVGLGLFLACTLLAFACKKDEGVSACVRLEGKWLCESWVENGEELLGAVAPITSADLLFKVLTGEQGDFERNTYHQTGDVESIIGAYTVNANCDQVTITPKAGVPVLYQFHFNGDLLLLESTIDGFVTTLQFRLE